MHNGAGNNGRSGPGWTGSTVGEAARDAYYDSLERTCSALRALLDTFGETIRRSRGVEAIDRSPTDREIALQLRLTSSTFLDIADALYPEFPKARRRDEVTTETKRIKRRGDSEPGRKGS